MEKHVLNEQQNRTLEKLGEVLPGVSLAEKMYMLGRCEGYNDARAIAEVGKKEEEENQRFPYGNSNPA